MTQALAELLATPSFDQVKTLVADDFVALDRRIQGELTSDVPMALEISRYVIESGGKRLRPLVVMLSARACGYRGVDHIKLATLVEFLHTATLLHDDVVDESALRRNKTSANSLWGNSASILVGDFLYSRAFELMVEIGSMDLMGIISHATNVIAEGEVMQLEHIGNATLDEATYMEIIRRKSAVLFQASAQTGASVAKAPSGFEDALREFGLQFGLAFQLIDDWLDYAGNSEIMGKNVGDDLREGKVTLPLIIALSRAGREDANSIRDAIRSKSGNASARVTAAVRRSGALDDVRDKAQYHTKRCIDSLQDIPESTYRAGLETLGLCALCRMR